MQTLIRDTSDSYSNVFSGTMFFRSLWIKDRTSNKDHSTFTLTALLHVRLKLHVFFLYRKEFLLCESLYQCVGISLCLLNYE